MNVALIIVWLIILAFNLAQPINLCAVDIGRHIANGQLITSGIDAVLHQNFYSFTFPQYPFINHHWLFGVVSFYLFQLGGFEILSIFYIAIMLMAGYLFLRAAFLRGHQALALAIAFLVLPILCDRREIRPEGISLLMMGLYYYLLTRLSLGTINRDLVFATLIIAQIIWVNTHIFFFMGPLLVAIFLLEGKARKCSVCVKQLKPLLLVTAAVNIINPSGLAGMLTPLNGFKGFGYRLAENQNLFFMMSFFPHNKFFPYCIGLVCLALVSIVVALCRKDFKRHIASIILFLFLIVAGIKANRLMLPFALFFIPLGSYFLGLGIGQMSHHAQKTWRKVFLCLIFVVVIMYGLSIKFNDIKIGLYPGVNASAEFYKQNNLKGPIFSNYDIGGYLIYHLHDKEKVFVDNRQEAFPKEFFKDVYMKIQQDDAAWAKALEQYNFNAIYFYRHDLTEWGQGFLIKRISDPRWAPVFVDAWTIIFLRRNAVNDALIKKFELPKTMFAVSKN